MGKGLLAILFVLLSLSARGCDAPAIGPVSRSGSPSPVSSPAGGPTTQPGQPGGGSGSSPLPDAALSRRITNGCPLINSQDLASLLVTAEIVRGTPKLSDVDHPIFSTEPVPTGEAYCIYYAYHKPGSKENVMIQTEYWVDVPGQAMPTAWAKVWADARQKATRPVAGVGEDAFYENGKLTFKKDGIYVTLEVQGTKVSTDTSAGVEQQLDMEKRLAVAAAGRME